MAKSKKAAAKKVVKAPKKKKGEEKKPLSGQVTERFMKVVGEVIMLNKRTGGPFRNYRNFAASIKCSYSVFSQYSDLTRNVTLEMCVELCLVHGVSGNWLLTGTGERYFTKESAKRLLSAEERMAEVEARIKALEKKAPAQKPVKKGKRK